MSSKTVLDRLKERGEEVFTQVSNELMMNPRFIKAMQAAMKGKETVDQGLTQAMKTMNMPTRTEFKRAVSRVESLETEMRELRDELRRTRAQAARASAAARTSTPKATPKPAAAKAPAKSSTRKAAPKPKRASKVPAGVATADVIVESPEE
jgi:polyhydroxyalkanoate synthesis regulator phasin